MPFSLADVMQNVRPQMPSAPVLPAPTMPAAPGGADIRSFAPLLARMRGLGPDGAQKVASYLAAGGDPAALLRMLRPAPPPRNAAQAASTPKPTAP